MSTSFKTSMFGGFDRSDVIAYIERTGREYEERVAALEAENETLRKENQTLENTQRVTQAQLLKMQDNEETCRRLRQQLADAEARNQELEQRCAQLKVQADEYESLKDHVAQIEISAHRRTEEFRSKAIAELMEQSGSNVIPIYCKFIEGDYTRIKGADALYTDIWASMGEEDKIPERVKLLTPYKVTGEVLKATENPDCIFLHCLPSFHDFDTTMAASQKELGYDIREVKDEVFLSPNSKVFDEAENRMHTIKAVMVATIGNV